MSEIQLTLILLGAFWAGTSSIFAGIKLTSELQDEIFVGKLGEHDLSVQYRMRLLVLHWVPLKLALAIISLVLGIIITALPFLRGGEGPGSIPFKLVCMVTAIMPFIGCLYQLMTGLVDGIFLRRSIRGNGAESSKFADPGVRNKPAKGLMPGKKR